MVKIKLSIKIKLKNLGRAKHQVKFTQGSMEHTSSSQEGSKTRAVSSQKNQATRSQIHHYKDDQVPQGPTTSYSSSSNDRCYSRVRDSLSITTEHYLSIVPSPEGLYLVGKRFKRVHGCIVLCTD